MPVRLSDTFVNQAKTIGEVMSRSGAGRIEDWAKIEKIAEENPDLPYELIKDILLGLVCTSELFSENILDYLVY